MSSASTLRADLGAAYARLAADLEAVFGPRLAAVVAYGPRLRSDRPAGRDVPGDALALVDGLTQADLTACLDRVAGWRRAGLNVPLLLGRDEFARSLDAFPLEYDDIIAHHVVVAGADPFVGLAVRADDLRRACEARAKGHLIHLREGYLETAGRAADLAALIVASAPAFSALLGNIARLIGATGPTRRACLRAVADLARVDHAVVDRVLDLEHDRALGGDEAVTLLPRYLDVVTRLAAFTDTWRSS
jgi:hypothetical protein